ncbi:hypothetical protein PFLUV_G00151430 [Perca fluviatilis]|uniref:Uncharacterized protein n=1 Tax=Perca fluviatilis TaxID=8168 RepID=A0A6A5EQ70_PERFL|nr:hypothetical protein PFLUV_G00151430 [Perca fluviatilis]
MKAAGGEIFPGHTERGSAERGSAARMHIIPELTQKTNSSDCRDAAEFVSAAGLHVAGASAGETTPALIQLLRTDGLDINPSG